MIASDVPMLEALRRLHVEIESTADRTTWCHVCAGSIHLGVVASHPRPCGCPCLGSSTVVEMNDRPAR